MLRSFSLKIVGGFLLDNEYAQFPFSQEYFAELVDVYRTANIVVPLTSNDAGEGQYFFNGTVRALVHFSCAMFNERCAFYPGCR